MEAGGGEAVAARRYPGESVGEAGGSVGEGDKDFQGQVGRLQGLKTDAVTLQRSAGWFVIGYFSHAEQSLGRGKGREGKKTG